MQAEKLHRHCFYQPALGHRHSAHEGSFWALTPFYIDDCIFAATRKAKCQMLTAEGVLLCYADAWLHGEPIH
ncbi:MAG TPA: hypothetical protein VMD98_14035 [Bryocella sp.]|nr:hypothetical protein [Bryocella sp.]